MGSQNPGQGAEGLVLRGQGQITPRQGIETGPGSGNQSLDTLQLGGNLGTREPGNPPGLASPSVEER